MKETILVTGSSGFIDFHMCNKLLEENIVLNKGWSYPYKTIFSKDAKNEYLSPKNWE